MSKSISNINHEILPCLRNYLQKTGKQWNYITPCQFYEKYFIKNTSSYVLIDIRRKSDYDLFHVPRSVNMFWLDILEPQHLRRLHRYHEQGKKIFLICYVGHTSSQAMTLLKLVGIPVTSIKYGYGISPIKGVPISGWIQNQYPIVYKKKK